MTSGGQPSEKIDAGFYITDIVFAANGPQEIQTEIEPYTGVYEDNEPTEPSEPSKTMPSGQPDPNAKPTGTPKPVEPINTDPNASADKKRGNKTN